MVPWGLLSRLLASVCLFVIGFVFASKPILFLHMCAYVGVCACRHLSGGEFGIPSVSPDPTCSL